MDRIETEASGGCQCGAVRWHVTAVNDSSHICHCRMCQKAAGNFFAALIGVPRDALTWTRGAPATFASSDKASRGFCRDCGTPLSFRYIAEDTIDVALGSLDEPARVPPIVAYGVESRMPWFDALPGLPGSVTSDDPPPTRDGRVQNRQHPDHDTER